MRYRLITDLGGFLWWVILRFCKTKLKEEQKQENWARNILFLIAIGVALTLSLNKLF